MVAKYVTLDVKKEFHISFSYVHFVLEDLHTACMFQRYSGYRRCMLACKKKDKRICTH